MSTWIDRNFCWLHPLELKLHQSIDLGPPSQEKNRRLRRARRRSSLIRHKEGGSDGEFFWYLILIFCHYISRVCNLEKSMPTYRTGRPEGGRGRNLPPTLNFLSLIYFCETGIRKNPFGFVFPYVLIHPAACATKMDRPRRLKNKWDSFLICGV